jgi:hypothetical protein
MHRFTRIAGAVSLAVALPLAAAVLGPGVFHDPIQGAAHGAVFGSDGKQIAVTTEFIGRAQSIYLARALESATAAQRARFESKRAYLDDLARGATGAADRQGALFARSLLLDWLIDEVAPADAARLRQRNNVLVSLLRRGIGHPEGAPYRVQPHEEAQLRLAGVLAATAAASAPSAEVLQAREAYAKKCRKAGVPLPPTWGKTGGGFWNSKGTLADPFISTTLTAEVFEYQSASPEGVCLALPRYGAAPGAQIELLGIICMGTGIVNSSGATVASACFWDNQKDKRGVPFPRTGEFPINTNFAAGEELDGGSGGTCTACHAGENAFIVHPDDNAFKGIANLRPKAWHRPIVAAGWPQNPGPNTQLATVPIPAGEESCLDCHSAGRRQRLPEIVKAIATPPGENYCDAVLPTAINKTMPPGGGVLPDPDYNMHNIVLIEMCDVAKK